VHTGSMFRKPKGGAGDKLDIPQGTLHLLVLTIVRREPLHGYGIAQRLQSLTHGAFRINPGSLFPALYALERDGLLSCEERSTENNRKARYYGLTARGRKRLEHEEQRWERVTGAIANVLKSA
jgi:PadR family transcriptional regulator, regulatory protein PadR